MTGGPPPRGDVAAVGPRVLEGAAAGPPVTTGFSSLDRSLGGGFRRGDLVVLAGDVAAGKSALALAMAVRAAGRGHPTAFLSGEMTVARVVERAVAIEGRAAIDDLRCGTLDEAARAATAAAAIGLRQRPLVLDTLRDGGVSGVSDLLVEHLGLDLTVVDPIQSLATGRLPLEEEMAHAARALKELAIRRSTAILAVTVLAISPRGRPDPRPRLEDLGGLGAIRQHADLVLGLFREEVYDPDPALRGATQLLVLKNRNGPTGFVDLYFHAECMRFEDLAE